MKFQKNKESLFSNFLYWLAILTSSTFGTTSGDFITSDTPLGALGGSVFLIILLLLIIILLHKKIISTLAFYWMAIIIIHPIGATLGNYISKPIGLNFGNVYTSFFLVALFVIVYKLEEKSIRKEN